MSEPTGLLFAALALFTISALFRRFFLTSNDTKPAFETISDADPLAELVPLNVLYSESQPMEKTASKQTSSVTLNLAPWQLEVAVEVDRLLKTEAKKERHTVPSTEEVRMPVDAFGRAAESEVCLHPR
jgi:hypothetical protein